MEKKDNGAHYESADEILHRAWRESISARIQSIELELNSFQEQLIALKESLLNLLEP